MNKLLINKDLRSYKINECIPFISKSKGEERVLSNMYNYCTIKFDGKIFNSSEKLFSWLLCDDEEVRKEILKLDNSFDIKRLLNKWKEKNKIDSKDFGMKGIKRGILYFCLKMKAIYCKRFRDFLLNSGDKPLVEYCYWLDNTKVDDELYGTRLDKENGVYIGVNACGRYMMKVREEIRKGLY